MRRLPSLAILSLRFSASFLSFLYLGVPNLDAVAKLKGLQTVTFFFFPTFAWALLGSKLLFNIGFFVTVPFFSASASANLRLVLASCVGRKTHVEDDGRFSLLYLALLSLEVFFAFELMWTSVEEKTCLKFSPLKRLLIFPFNFLM